MGVPGRWTGPSDSSGPSRSGRFYRRHRRSRSTKIGDIGTLSSKDALSIESLATIPDADLLSGAPRPLRRDLTLGRRVIQAEKVADAAKGGLDSGPPRPRVRPHGVAHDCPRDGTPAFGCSSCYAHLAQGHARRRAHRGRARVRRYDRALARHERRVAAADTAAYELGLS